MTERLYMNDPDLLSFSAVVISCEPQADHWIAVLDRSAFYPQGGGQGADRGTMGNASVIDVQQKAGVVYHTIDQALCPGSMVDCHVDAVRRLDMMQQHSGEHIFSGLVCQTFGCSNVGFHIGTDAVTMDFDHMISQEEALDIERRANEAIWADLPIKAWIPPRDELEQIDYRSKKAIEGDVRLVSIPGIDTCACCGTHVQHTGRVGQVKLLGVQKYKKGVRISILCGRRALQYENLMLQQLRQVARLLSGKQQDAASAVSRLLQERDQLKSTVESLGMQIFELQAQEEMKQHLRIIACDALQPSQLRAAAERLSLGADAAIVLLPRAEGWSFACAAQAMDIRPLTKVLTDTFGGKGGGPKDMTQGALMGGTVQEIRTAAISALASIQ